jgi:arylsulfatase A-like enzyme
MPDYKTQPKRKIMSNGRPNILVIQADQLATNALGAYQNRLAITPKT